MKTKNKINDYIIRTAACAALLSCLIVGFSSAFNLTGKWSGLSRSVLPGGMSKPTTQTKALTFADRVAYQRAIEEVYWRHRIWPSANASAKPPLGQMMSQSQIEKKVEDYLHNSQVLADYWQRPINSEQLQAEMDRMARHTKQPQVLRELFQALGDDPFVIAECLARPVLAQRLLMELNNEDRAKPTTVAWRMGAHKKVAAIDSIAKAVQVNSPYQLPKISSDLPDTCTDDTWTPTSLTNAPDGRILHTAVWTGSEMIVWGGGGTISDFNTGGKYNPTTDSWTATSTSNAPDARSDHTAVWTGTEMIVWGGVNPTIGVLNTGGRYNPSIDTWTATSTTNAPEPRSSFPNDYAVWTGTEMIVWGGDGPSGQLNTGGKYNPTTDSWTATSTTNAPLGRDQHTTVWTGTEMIVWGGADENNTPLNTGGRYNPSTDSWTATSLTNAPDGRRGPEAVWADSQMIMIVWGGQDVIGLFLNTGGRYNPSTDSWTATTLTNAPDGRYGHTTVWTGSEMIVWAGGTNFGFENTGGRYNPSTDSWTATSTTNAPAARYLHMAVWTGSQMINWGGWDEITVFNTGGRYCAQSGSTPTPTPTATATATATPTATATATATPTPTPTPTPCTGRCTPTPRPRPTPAPRP